MSLDGPFSVAFIRVCGKGFTIEQIHNEECEIWNRSQRGCSKCPHFVERSMIGFVVVPPNAVKQEYLDLQSQVETKKRIES